MQIFVVSGGGGVVKLISTLVGGYREGGEMEHIECYISYGGHVIFIRNLVNGKMIGNSKVFFNSTREADILFRGRRNLEFSDLERFDDFWGGDATFYFLKETNGTYLENPKFFCYRRETEYYVKCRVKKEIILKYFTSLFLKLINYWANSYEVSIPGKLLLIREFKWDSERLGEFYDLLEGYFERLMRHNRERYFVDFSQFKWFRAVVEL